VHLARARTVLAEHEHCAWATHLIELLRRTHTAASARANTLWVVPSGERMTVLHAADPHHPYALSPPGIRGKPTHAAARHLVDRVLTRNALVLAFLLDLQVPFDNTLAERDVRMVNVHQKVSGTFLSEQGAVSWCGMRGSFSTLRTQGRLLLNALESTCRGHPLLPSFKAT
jgi:transposase